MKSPIPSARKTIQLAIAFAVTAFLCPRASAQQPQQDDHNPVGVTGVFEGMITTGCAYNALNHNARREINDIVVPGAIGKYGLKMTRYYNSRNTAYLGVMGPGWSHEYMWANGNDKVLHPNGDVWDSHCAGAWSLPGPLGVSEWTTTWNGHPAFRLADGGTVVFGNASWPGFASQIIDPYGQTTTLTYDQSSGQLTWVTEPGGRKLQFIYSVIGGNTLLTEVAAYDGQGHQTDSVIYHYASKPTGGTIVTSAMCLTQVDYSDGTHAYYTYTTDNQPDHQGPPCPCMIKLLPLVIGCDDVRYPGPMRRIAYEYQSGGPHGAILKERYWDGVAGHEGNGSIVSRIDPPAPSPLLAGVTFPTAYTEYRGDGPTRAFNYTSLSLGRPPSEETCPSFNGPAPQQFLTSYTDFQGNTAIVGYDANWYVNSVRDANLHTTSYTRGPPPSAYPGPKGIGQILTITHPGGSHIDYGYYDEGSGNISGHYIHTVSNERQKVTTYTRDGNYRVTRIDYPQDANTPASFEEFQYNSFGQVTAHHLKNGAWKSFVYDSRGLLTDEYNAKSTVPGGSDPHTHYDYYTAADGNLGWIDRVKTVTLRANESNLHAAETYEYDRTLTGGITNLSGAAVAGRGLVTKVTHADTPSNTYKRFKYDAYGNKVWEDNELRKITQYAYDDYNRLLSVTDPLSNTTQYDYAPTQGNTSQSQQHTSNSPSWVTSPATIVTHNVYDGNWRKTSITAAYNTLNLTTQFVYDNVGNLTDVTDPRGKKTHHGYDNRNRKTSTTEAYQTTLAATTVWHYDPASNINEIDRPDSIHETKGYDAVNRMIWHTVPRQVPGPSPTPTPINLMTHIYYNPSGTTDHVTDQRGKVTYFQYDASDEKTRMTYQDASFQSWAWDNAHNLASRTTVHGETQTFHYDIRNRKVAMVWSNTVDWANYSYYADNRLNTASNPNSTVTRNYDAAGRLTLDQQNVTGLGSAKSVNYPNYDADGRLTQMNVGGATYDYTYGYDQAGRFQTISPTNSSTLFQYFYDAASNEVDRYSYLPNTVQIDQHYNRDSLNRMSSRLVKKNGTTFSTEAYTLDHMNWIREVNRGGVADDFGYYWSDELLSAQYGGGPYFPFTEGQDPDLDTIDSIDPNAGYKPPDTEDPEPAPPPDDYSDPPVGGFVPPAIVGGRSVTYYVDRAGNRQQLTDSASPDYDVYSEQY